MKLIKNAVFLKSIDKISDYQNYHLPEFVFVGWSNVGKSSLINMIANNSKLARVSATQGKTKLINFFSFNYEFVLVDLPGYGYATTSKVESHKWEKMIQDYLEGSVNLAGALLLVDVRHNPTEQDIQMLEYFTYHNIPVTVVATKYDKLKKSEKMKKISAIANTFNLGVENIYLCSSETAYGKDALIDRIYQFVSGD